MDVDFASIYNRHERAVQDTVLERCGLYPALAADADLLADVACVALNRLPARYIRHHADYAFYLTEREAAADAAAVAQAVQDAFEFVQARAALREQA